MSGALAAAQPELPQHEADRRVRGQVSQSLVKHVEETETHVRLLPTEAARQGPEPVDRGCPTASREHALIARLVADFKARGLTEQAIAVLSPRKEWDRIDALCRVFWQSCEVCWASNDFEPIGGVESLTRPSVRLLTIYAAKGLEYLAVIVSAVDQSPSLIEPDEVRDSNLFYFALTRASDHLAATWVGHRTFTDPVLGSNKAERIDDGKRG